MDDFPPYHNAVSQIDVEVNRPNAKKKVGTLRHKIRTPGTYEVTKEIPEMLTDYAKREDKEGKLMEALWEGKRNEAANDKLTIQDETDNTDLFGNLTAKKKPARPFHPLTPALSQVMKDFIAGQPYSDFMLANEEAQAWFK